ncbi:MAG: hypothetical protein JSW68_06210 [Burkholderiales bacterium]|nr:MAG: hypothetical protein JSW68_06210 [Burkholderiales bacterium]
MQSTEARGLAGGRQTRLRAAAAWLRSLVVLGVWLALVLKAHETSHAYDWEAAGRFGSSTVRVFAVALGLTALTQLALLSLPLRFRLGRRGLILLFVWFLLVVFGHSLSDEEVAAARAMTAAVRDAVGPTSVLVLGLLYAVVLAVPFVPAVEVGLLTMAVFGKPGAAIVYLATLFGLAAAFGAGRLLPAGLLERWLGGLTRAKNESQLRAALGARAAPGLPSGGAGVQPPDQPGGGLRRYRYVVLGLLLNTPGNSALGGGGGIAFVCGLSRRFGWRSFLLTIALATSPVPLLVLAGVLDIDRILERRRVICDTLTQLQALLPGF